MQMSRKLECRNGIKETLPKNNKVKMFQYLQDRKQRAFAFFDKTYPLLNHLCLKLRKSFMMKMKVRR